MPHHSTAHHHYHIRKRIHQKNEKYPHPDKLKRIFDSLVYAMSIIVPLITTLQVYQIWKYKNASGVSLPAWGIYLLSAITWLTYGIIHKEKPIIILNSMLIITDALVVIGTIMYG